MNENLTRIARGNLGKDATQADIQKEIADICRLNGIEDPDKIYPGQKLQLPGHTADGGVVKRGEDGSTETIWPDGTKRARRSDGSGSVIRPDGSEHNWGPKSEDIYEEIKIAAGRFKIPAPKFDTSAVKNAVGAGLLSAGSAVGEVKS